MWRKRTGENSVAPFSEPVGVVIAEDGISEGDVRRSLGDLLPLRVVWWGNQDYVEVISALRPVVIVVLGSNDELTRDCCRLLACLFSGGAPTAISAWMVGAPSAAPNLQIHLLGTGASAHIASLSDLRLT
jgi:hypothetical protein